MTIGASCPWNLSTVPILAPGIRSFKSNTCALYGAMTKISSRVTGFSSPLRSTHVDLDPKISTTIFPIASPSSGDEF
jgi:hypothetical protein